MIPAVRALAFFFAFDGQLVYVDFEVSRWFVSNQNASWVFGKRIVGYGL